MTGEQVLQQMEERVGALKRLVGEIERGRKPLREGMDRLDRLMVIVRG